MAGLVAGACDLGGQEVQGGDFVRGEIRTGRVAACHDLSDGGLLAAIAEMAMAGERGVQLEAAPDRMTRIAYLFGEDQGRYLIETAYSETLLAAASAAGPMIVPMCSIRDFMGMTCLFLTAVVSTRPPMPALRLSPLRRRA